MRSPFFISVLLLLTFAWMRGSGRIQQQAQILHEQKGQPLGVTIEGNTGFASFQHLQVPLDESLGVRADGNPSGPDVSSHTGLPVRGKIGLNYQFAHGYADTGIEYTKIWGLVGAESTPSASYSRFAFDSGLSLGYGGGWLRPFAVLRAGWRRSGFYNVSSGHYIDAAVLRGGAGVETSGWRLLGIVGKTPWTRMAYDGTDSTDKLGSAKVEVTTAELSSSWHIHGRTWLDFGYDQELTSIVIQDIADYEKFGLNVLPSRQRTRAYDLETGIFRVGFRKSF
jgi:hypothetical protein